MQDINDLKEKYNSLENETLNTLIYLIKDSNYKSKFIEGNAIKVNVFDYVELVIVNRQLTFLDSKGLDYSLFADSNLEDLIDIIDEQTT